MASHPPSLRLKPSMNNTPNIFTSNSRFLPPPVRTVTQSHYVYRQSDSQRAAAFFNQDWTPTQTSGSSTEVPLSPSPSELPPVHELAPVPTTKLLVRDKQMGSHPPPFDEVLLSSSHRILQTMPQSWISSPSGSTGSTRTSRAKELRWGIEYAN